MPATTKSEYKHPQSEQEEACGLGRRILVMLYDAIALIALMMAVTALSLMTPLRDQTALVDPWPTFVLIVIWFLYLAWCWRRGLTLGMRAWRVKLVFGDGQEPGWGILTLRFVVSLASATCLGLGFVWSLFDAQRRTWHDRISDSRLIRTPKRSDRSA